MNIEEMSPYVPEASYNSKVNSWHRKHRANLRVMNSKVIEGKYVYYWERRQVGGTVYRWDNCVHGRWRDLETSPTSFS